MLLKDFIKKINLESELKKGMYDGIEVAHTSAGDLFIIVDVWMNPIADLVDDIFRLAEEDGVEIELEDGSKVPPADCDLWFYKIVDVLTDYGYNWGYKDEYTSCCGCGVVIGIYPSNARYEYWVNDGEILCSDCVRENVLEDYIEHLTNNCHSANNLLTDRELRDFGFKPTGDRYQTGLHEGMNDDPEGVYEKLKDRYDVLFNIKENSPFHTEWEVYIKEKEEN